MYLKNDPSPNKLSVHMKSATDGSAVTSGVSVTVDGVAGLGTTTHEGSGVWSYLPTQAETNADVFVVLFSAVGALPNLYDVHTTPVDLSLLALAADIAAIEIPDVAEIVTGVEGSSVASDVANVLADTNELQTDWETGGRLESKLKTASEALTITPLAATVSAGEVSSQEIVQYVNTSDSVTISITDSDGQPVELMGLELAFNVYDKKHELLFSRTTNDGITVTGEDNNIAVVAFSASNTNAANMGNYRFDLRDETNGRELFNGAYILKYSHKVT